jgi:hypothetical protein
MVRYGVIRVIRCTGTCETAPYPIDGEVYKIGTDLIVDVVSVVYLGLEPNNTIKRATRRRVLSTSSLGCHDRHPYRIADIERIVDVDGTRATCKGTNFELKVSTFARSKYGFNPSALT